MVKLSAAFVGLLLALTLLAGCDDSDRDLCRPEIPAGMVAGIVRAGGVQVNVMVTAARIPEDGETALFVQAEPDSAGRYRMDLPAGRYILSLTSDCGPYYSYRLPGHDFDPTGPDTLRIDPDTSPVTADFELTLLQIEMGLSDRLNGWWGEASLYPRGGGAAPFGSVRSPIAYGELDLILFSAPPGKYRVEIAVGRGSSPCGALRDAQHFWFPGTRDSAESPWIALSVDEPKQLYGSLGHEPACLAGSVEGAWLDLGLTPPSIALFAPDSSRVLDACRVGISGEFNLDVCTAGPVKALVTQEGIDQWIGGATFDEAEVFDLICGETLSDVRLSQCGLRLKISAPEAGLGGAWFRLYRSSDSVPVAQWYEDSGTNLLLGIPNLRPGTYRLYVEPEDPETAAWNAQWFDRADRAEDAQPIRLANPGDVETIALTLPRR